MSDERDELRGALANTICNVSNYPKRAMPYLLGGDMSPVLDRTADALLATGYRKPQQVTTAEERAVLPPGTIAMDSKGNAWKRGAGSWVGTGEGGPLFDYMDLPLTVLHIGGAE